MIEEPGCLAAGHVRARGGHLDHRERLDQIRIQAQLDAGDVEVFHRARGLHAVVGAGRHGLVAQEVVFETRGGARHAKPLFTGTTASGCGSVGPAATRQGEHDLFRQPAPPARSFTPSGSMN
jgi:hypothetical protein